jgi:hypothetical protein
MVKQGKTGKRDASIIVHEMNRLSALTKVLQQQSKGIVSKRSLATRSRQSSGGGGHNHHHQQGPYDLPHHPTYHEKAYLFNIKPNEYKREGWEIITWMTYLVAGGIFVAALSTKDFDEFSVSS